MNQSIQLSLGKLYKGGDARSLLTLCFLVYMLPVLSAATVPSKFKFHATGEWISMQYLTSESDECECLAS